MTTGAIIVAIITAITAAMLTRFGRLYFKIFIIVIVAYGSAYCAYWAPVWFGATDDQYSSWSQLFIHPWFIVGLVSGFITLFGIKHFKSNSKGKNIEASKSN